MDLKLSGNAFTSGETPEVYDVIVIGGGPAGSTAAIYTARADLSTLVIDKGVTAGALGVNRKISNYPGVPGPVGGAELLESIRRQAASFGARFVAGKVISVVLHATPKQVMTGEDTYYARAVILATGALGRTQTLPGENEFLGRGVSYCVTCDGAFFRGQDVAVVGNNDEALEEALRLTTFARRVYLLAPTPALKASAPLAEQAARHPEIELRLSAPVLEVVGDGQVQGVRVQQRGSTGGEELLPVRGVFVYLQGQQPIVDYLMGQLEVSPQGCLTVDHEMSTGVPGVFAVGDLLCLHPKQAVVAAADGATAAIAVESYLRGRERSRPDWG